MRARTLLSGLAIFRIHAEVILEWPGGTHSTFLANWEPFLAGGKWRVGSPKPEFRIRIRNQQLLLQENPSSPSKGWSVYGKFPGNVAAEVTRRISWQARATLRLVTSGGYHFSARSGPGKKCKAFGKQRRVDKNAPVRLDA